MRRTIVACCLLAACSHPEPAPVYVQPIAPQPTPRPPPPPPPPPPPKPLQRVTGSIVDPYAKPPGASYVGCFIDGGERDLPLAKWEDSQMTVERCAAHCQGTGEFFGVQYGSQCFCGHSYGRFGVAADAECAMGCAGNPSQKCGASWRNSIYKIGGAPVAAAPSPGPRPSACPDGSAPCTCPDKHHMWCHPECRFPELCDGSPNSSYPCAAPQPSSGPRYAGCFDATALRNPSWFRISQMTPSLCIDACRKNGQPLALLGDTDLCGCAPDYDRTKSVAESDCARPCAGDSSQSCGREWRARVFELSGSSSGGIHIVAGTYGENCKAPHGNVTADLARSCEGRAQCDYKVDVAVLGDPAGGCGKTYQAEWRCGDSPTVMSAGAPPEAGYGAILKLRCGALPSAAPKHLGCFAAQVFAQPGAVEVKDPQLTPSRCFDTCRKKGLAIAGLSMTACDCAPAYDRSLAPRPATDCENKCSGDPAQGCGGDWRYDGGYRYDLYDLNP